VSTNGGAVVINASVARSFSISLFPDNYFSPNCLVNSIVISYLHRLDLQICQRLKIGRLSDVFASAQRW